MAKHVGPVQALSTEAGLLLSAQALCRLAGLLAYYCIVRSCAGPLCSCWSVLPCSGPIQALSIQAGPWLPARALCRSSTLLLASWYTIRLWVGFLPSCRPVVLCSGPVQAFSTHAGLWPSIQDMCRPSLLKLACYYLFRHYTGPIPSYWPLVLHPGPVQAFSAHVSLLAYPNGDQTVACWHGSCSSPVLLCQSPAHLLLRQLCARWLSSRAGPLSTSPPSSPLLSAVGPSLQ